ncbi:MAG TPA: sigma-70 family RNA polymerase sigma factor [Puia sp.]|nr:sigma-70 family RNA polymerase sigma factor [Puia sp.]
MTEETAHNDRILLLQMARGDEKGLTGIVRLYWKDIYSQAIVLLKSAEEAEELTQDIFLKVWNARDQLEHIENFANWLFIVARNTIITAFRKKLNRPGFLQEQEAEEVALRPDRQAELRPDHQAEHREQYRLLLKGISLLPEKRQQVFRLSRMEGLTHEQIAERLGIHKDTVAQYIVKAVAFLRSYLREHQGTPP